MSRQGFELARAYGSPLDDVLAVLRREGPLTFGGVCHKAGFSRAFARRALDRLVGAGAVEVIGGARAGFPVRYAVRRGR